MLPCRRLVLTLALSMTAGATLPSHASDYPARPITLIVPFAAGGTNDTLSRIIAEHLAKTLRQPVVIENDAGAAGTTAATKAARAAPDGYTLIMGNMGTHGVAPFHYRALRYDPVRDFTPIGVTAEVPAVLVARRDFPANTLPEFVDYVRRHQDKVSEAHVGIGSPTHTFCTLLHGLMGTKVTRIPYRGGAQAMADLVAGHADFSCISLSGAVTQIQAGTLKALAIASRERAEMVANVPTAAEAGMPDFT
ncbi:MAG: tripartite tricarboxylate transporter substrate-binding protein, partial [Alphaproteobacteria bacterium]